MKTVEEARRELFEAWYEARSGYKPRLQESGGYLEIGPALAWAGFNAALDAVEIELPPFEDWPSSMANDMKQDCRSAIESNNLGIKVK